MAQTNTKTNQHNNRKMGLPFHKSFWLPNGASAYAHHQIFITCYETPNSFTHVHSNPNQIEHKQEYDYFITRKSKKNLK